MGEEEKTDKNIQESPDRTTKLQEDSKMRITDESVMFNDTVRLQASVDGVFTGGTFKHTERTGIQARSDASKYADN